MGVGWRYRHAWVFADKIDMPISTTVTDDAQAFWPMGEVGDACRSWNDAVDYYETEKYAIKLDSGWEIH